MCGFHMLYNAKCLLKSILAERQYGQYINLINITCQREFFKDIQKTKRFLMKCPNSYYVNEQDKKQLASLDPLLERSHLYYLINNEPEMLEF